MAHLPDLTYYYKNYFALLSNNYLVRFINTAIYDMDKISSRNHTSDFKLHICSKTAELSLFLQTAIYICDRHGRSCA